MQKMTWILGLLTTILITASLIVPYSTQAAESWEKIDKRLKTQVYHLNIGLKIRLNDKYYVELADLTPNSHLAVFATRTDDPGYRVVGYGSTFPIKTKPQSSKETAYYFLTNRHVAESAEPIISECQKFFAAAILYAEQTSPLNADDKLENILAIINDTTKNSKERTSAKIAAYRQLVDSIWNAYESQLSIKADPQRSLYNKYLTKANLEFSTGYFLHCAGPVSNPSIEATLYRVGREGVDPDLAILKVESKQDSLKTLAPILAIDLDNEAAVEGQEIQVIGYPSASDQIDADAGKYYLPTFSTGRISRVAPKTIQVDASITTGNSGGPVINMKGKAVGVVANRAISKSGSELTNFAGAISVPSIKSFAPEILSK